MSHPAVGHGHGPAPAGHRPPRAIGPARALGTLTTLILASAGAACSTVGPDDPPSTAASITIVSGNGQAAFLGQVLPESLVVVVLDTDGDPVPGQTVAFTVEAGTGTLAFETIETDAAGRASNQFTLGTEPGEEQIVARVRVGVEATFVETSVRWRWHLECPYLPDTGCDLHRMVGDPFFPLSYVRDSDVDGNPIDPALTTSILPGPGLSIVGEAVYATLPLDAYVRLAHPPDRIDSLHVAFLEDQADSQWHVIKVCRYHEFTEPSRPWDSIRVEMTTDSVRYSPDTESRLWRTVNWFGTAVVDTFPVGGSTASGSEYATLAPGQGVERFWGSVGSKYGSVWTVALIRDTTGTAYTGVLESCPAYQAGMWWHLYEVTATRLR